MAYLNKTFEERIVILDGAMGTQLQTYKLTEEDYRGTMLFHEDPSWVPTSDIQILTFFLR